MNIAQVVLNNECTGCFSCLESCPVKCISVNVNSEGFKEPIVRLSQCVECGACVSACHTAAINDYHPAILGYVAEVEDDALYRNSASGGVFTSLSKRAIGHGYVVYGAVFDKEHRVIHSRVSDIDGIKKLQGSKYVQSDTVGIYRQVKDDLIAGKKVMFSGTPCQIAGLRAYLKADYDNLLMIDLVCHGVPSPGLWKKHLEEDLLRDNPDIESISFRTKSNYDRFGYVMQVVSKGETALIPSSDDLFYYLFVNNISLRESCYRCKYACSMRISDITLGDCGSVEAYPKFGMRGATSIVLLNSSKGTAAFRQLSDGMRLDVLDIEREILANRQLNAPSYRPEARDRFFKDISSVPYHMIKDEYLPKKSIIRKIWDKIKMLVPWQVRCYIKK